MGTRILLSNTDFSNNYVLKLSFKDTCSQQINSLALLPGIGEGWFTVNSRHIMKIFTNSERSCILVPQSNIVFPTQWENVEKGNYDAIFVPKGTKNITVKTTDSSIEYGFTLSDVDGYCEYDAGWQYGNAKLSVDVSQYTASRHMYLGIAFKGNTGSKTLTSLGFSLTMSQ